MRAKKSDFCLFHPLDFGKLTVKAIHLELEFDIYEEHTCVRSVLHLQALEDIDSLELNAKGLEIIGMVSRIGLKYTYEAKKSKIFLSFDRMVGRGEKFSVESVTVCRPTSNVLEGLYYDHTPKGCPRTQITQCQQWGFQRLVPCLDDMTAKCTYRTKITADKRYTHMITNGDVSSPRRSAGNGRDTITYDNMITPMAPYLFFLCVGTYSSFTRPFRYPDGTVFTLELLAPLGSPEEEALKALKMLEECIMWIYLFTGKEMHSKPEIRKQMWSLFLEGKDFSHLLSGITPGYKYTGTVYREIGMQNSNFGGMENVGNTTITANRLMPSVWMTDSAFEYMVRVKLHEFYHNLNGSEVTGYSPFELWLNEAVTVHIELAYNAFLNGENYSRLSSVLGIVSPDNGTLLQDENPTSLPILPKGFNSPDDLITGVTYVKGPELIRMIETLMGKEKFSQGLAYYHKKYSHSNARTEDWLDCMDKVSGAGIRKMALGWLGRRGFPILEATLDNKNGRKKITLIQIQKGRAFEFPCKIAVLDNMGNDVEEKTVRVGNRKTTVSFRRLAGDSILSINRGLSFFGRVAFDEPMEKQLVRARKDSDAVNRWIAWNSLMEKEKIRLMKNTTSEPHHKLVELFFEKISDVNACEKYGSLHAALFDSVSDKRYAHMYTRLYEAKRRFVSAVAGKYRDALLGLYRQYNKSKLELPYLQKRIIDMKMRSAKNLCLSIIARLDTPEIHKMIKEQFYSSNNATDRIIAFSLYINSSAPDRRQMIRKFMDAAKKSPVAWELFLSAIGGNDSPDYLDIIRMVESSGAFDINQSNEQRALFGRFVFNKKKSLETKDGLAYLAGLIKRLSRINEYTAAGFISAFGFVGYMERKHQPGIKAALRGILDSLSLEEAPSVYNSIRMILNNL